jgi:hypothetical protein
LHTTVCITPDTKEWLERLKAPGQSFNGFITQLLQQWEETPRAQPAGASRRSEKPLQGQ